MQNLHVLLTGATRHRLLQGVVRHAEPAGREQILSVPIVLERPGLPHQPVDHVPVVDAVLFAPHLPRQSIDFLLAVPDFQVVGLHADVDPFADQPAVDRVHVPLHPDQTSRIDTHSEALNPVVANARQSVQPRGFLRETCLSAGVASRDQLAEKTGVFLAMGELPASPQHQRKREKIAIIGAGSKLKPIRRSITVSKGFSDGEEDERGARAVLAGSDRAAAGQRAEHRPVL